MKQRKAHRPAEDIYRVDPEQEGYDEGEPQFFRREPGDEADLYADQMDLPLDEYADEYAERYGDRFDPEMDGDIPYALTEEKAARRTIFKPRERKPGFIPAVLVGAFRLLVLTVLLIGLSGVGAVVGIARAYMDTAPDLDLTLIDDQAQTSFIFDAEGNLITDYKGTENRVMVSIDTMPMYLRNAFVACEDARFYTHNGVDLKRIAGALISNVVSGGQQGGSTIQRAKL